ncbi:MAG TPA: Do family serine endopeptidase [Gammaproteobacteria bacterium]|nr:Do family serine endopeptidase [Gammaproteobacteria bacterium]
MKHSSPFWFIIKAAIAGLAVAFVILALRPDLLGQSRPVVEITESTPQRTLAGSGPVSYADAVDAAAPAVVNVYTTKIVTERANPLYRDPIFRYFFGDQLAPRQRLETSLGSGVIVSNQGYILTNNHVIEGAADIQVALRDGRSIEATLVGTDRDTDLAVLKIDMQALPAITFGSSENLRVGDVVLAIGNPFGFGQTVTIGITSATGRNRVGISTFENFIQTDAAINPGNSGGALINAHGQLVGINTAIVSRSGGSQGIGFAIPVDLAKEIMSQIIETGHVVRGWLGVEGQDITPQLAESFGLQGVRGVIIAGVQRNGPAGRAGLRPGDILTHINGQPTIDSKTSMDLIAGFSPGTRITLRILRAGLEMELKAIVAERPSRPGSGRG